ncbi:toll/interleukin-1 receptor domain-containing protein [Desulfobacterales bacterium HSG2]|nr:toll/interleukin-1 receptor domain-containing protein [Desulfobacterales bacterium HSG2]
MKSCDYLYDVLISHADADAEFAREIAEYLRSSGIKVWFAPWETVPGDHIPTRLSKGMKESRRMAAVWSERYFRDRGLQSLAESFVRKRSGGGSSLGPASGRGLRD